MSDVEACELERQEIAAKRGITEWGMLIKFVDSENNLVEVFVDEDDFQPPPPIETRVPDPRRSAGDGANFTPMGR